MYVSRKLLGGTVPNRRHSRRTHLLLILALLFLVLLPGSSVAQQRSRTETAFTDASQSASSSSYLLHLPLGPDWQTTITLTNPTSGDLTVILSPYDKSGAQA